MKETVDNLEKEDVTPIEEAPSSNEETKKKKKHRRKINARKKGLWPLFFCFALFSSRFTDFCWLSVDDFIFVFL